MVTISAELFADLFALLLLFQHSSYTVLWDRIGGINSPGGVKGGSSSPQTIWARNLFPKVIFEFPGQTGSRFQKPKVVCPIPGQTWIYAV